MITQIKLDESTKLEFGVAITGADSTPTARFIIEGKDFSIMIPCKQVNENVEVEIPAMKKFFTSGEYDARLEIILDNKIYTPLSESIVFEPSIEIATKQKPVTVKESVKVSKVTVKKTQINEHMLRKTQAAMIIAQSLGYKSDDQETPQEIIEHAIKNAGVLNAEQAKTLNDMLDLAESVGIDISRVDIPEVKPVIVEQKTSVEAPKGEDDLSDEELDDMIDGLSDDDYLHAYDDDELAVVDDETGEQLDEDISESEELNEVLSRIERMKARVRMAKTKTKRYCVEETFYICCTEQESPSHGCQGYGEETS